MGSRLAHTAVLVLVGCASAPATKVEPPATPTAAVPDEQVMTLRLPRLRIVDAKLGEERSSKREPIMVEFGVNQNGTELVYALLEQAGMKGAAAVGDLTLYMTFRWQGGPVECRTRVLLEGDPRLAAAAGGATNAGAARTTAYDTEIESYKPQPVDFMAEDRELSCETKRVPVTRKRLVENRSDRTAEAGGGVKDLAADEEIVTTYETHDRCQWKQVTRRTTRYDYEVKLGFVPPNWEHLSQRFARRPIVAAAPRCYTITDEELARQPIYRLTATAYHRGKVAQRAPQSLPSRTAVEAQLSPMNMNPRDCERILRAATGKKYGPGPATGKNRSDGLGPSPDVEEAGLFSQCSREQQLKNLDRERNSSFFKEQERAEATRYEENDDEPPFDAD
jgi:hypothetical protein